MHSDTIGLKVLPKDASAKCLFILRKYNDSAIMNLKKIILNSEYVLKYSYTDSFGLKAIIQCYEELSKIGVTTLLFELDDKPTDIEGLKTLNDTYDEISAEIDEENDE